MASSSPRGLRVDQLLSRFGYCSRREAGAWVRSGRVRIGEAVVEDAGERVSPVAVRIDGEPVEGPEGLLVMLHKPTGVVCSHDGREGPSIYGLLPPRWLARNPPVTSVGRLDKETSGLLLVTDLGEWVHRWTSPKHHVEKTYEVSVDGEFPVGLAERFAAGTLCLDDEDEPCRPARLEIDGPREARLHLTEGRYHQVRRMFAAVGLTVVRLHRPRFGEYVLGDLAPAQWRRMSLPEAPGGGRA